jgi:GNAT superfamily N-acetyltransferase
LSCAGEAIVAFAGLMLSRDAVAAPNAGEVGALYVHPEWWRRGVGRRLLDASLAFLQQQGFTEAILWTLEDNASARAFYEAEGWIDDGGRQPLDAGRPIAPLTEVRYRKTIAR